MSTSRRDILVAVSLACALTLEADEVFLQGVFSIRLNPLVPLETNSASPSEEEIATLLLEEARWIFSGMIFGFSYSYTPLDRTRRVEEEFTLQPLAEIPWGDPGLRVLQTWVEDHTFYANISYTLREDLTHWYRTWQSAKVETSEGEGLSSALEGYTARKKAVEEAVKQAIREYARARIFNKPMTLTGKVALAEPPRLTFSGDRYRAHVRTFLTLEHVEPYTLF
ncbi:hypothetical protein Spith_2220 [Spirochaeta thermophila DSM 6578]|uniref:DUF4390 domain-containing protein n=1 Tax=Winmispira thermophila (strain ATCC 700085 / DSM 6578 / Z-1203) TaxID=869211 RepID=G0GFZ9_WINT7|nr:hypothetical protein [Spirochaeta thermophila]AEJ62475.1 hypothetical protein Spith_2220 [Spirochaeta thermophila DSM 6578]